VSEIDLKVKGKGSSSSEDCREQLQQKRTLPSDWVVQAALVGRLVISSMISISLLSDQQRDLLVVISKEFSGVITVPGIP